MGILACNSQCRLLLYLLTHTPSNKQQQEFSHINLSSPHPCDPMKVCFPSFYLSLEEELVGVRYISAMVASHTEEEYYDKYCVFLS